MMSVVLLLCAGECNWDRGNFGGTVHLVGGCSLVVLVNTVLVKFFVLCGFQYGFVSVIGCVLDVLRGSFECVLI